MASTKHNPSKDFSPLPPFPVTYGVNFFGRYQDLKYIIAKIGILDFCIKNFFDLVLFSAYGTQNVPAFFSSDIDLPP